MQNSSAMQDRILEAGPLRVRFFWQEDRYAHEISVQRSDVWEPQLTSVEGSPADDWPSSPPFQSLHIEQRDDGRTLALLVGMAGKSHWSASVEIEVAVPCVSFDVACRARDCELGPLGSTYRPCGEHASASSIELTHRFGPANLETNPEGLRVAAQASGVSPQTVRWDYRVCLPTAG